ncbi:class A beta-lactamase [Acetobacter fallax]|uniref:Beta-lactamase n=1 Tax=Acetobacter fallax TaxID=1737473 RepID=A0ABX0K8E6_9PROT|nr:class A beta-lactamase [Acetobacter fallax]NHO31476.1 class A beta-lactamase [Acetobacter fallax]NHO34940.1 class A beta-lactamase [Acetobacter fallax]
MCLKRRTLILGIPAFLASPAVAGDAALVPLREYERASGGHIGIYAKNISSGATFAWRAHDRFVMCSTVKASLVAFVLSEIDRGHGDLDEMIHYSAADTGDLYAPVARANLSKGVLSVRDMCRAAVEVSDNVCCNLLLKRVGGPPVMTAFWRTIGDHVTRLDHPEPFLNRTRRGESYDTTTPAAMAENLRKFVVGDVLSAKSRAWFTELLIGCQTGGNRLRSGLPGNWVTGNKTGHNGRDAAGDIAVSWPDPRTPVVICVYTRGGAPTNAQFDAVFAGAGRLVASHLVRERPG